MHGSDFKNVFVIGCAVIVPTLVPILASPQTGSRAEALNMRLVGYHDLQARTAYQPTIHKQGNRWIAYIGHHGDSKPNPLNGGAAENNGTSIVDVTDPHHPKYLAHIPGEAGKAEQGGAQMV